MTPDQISFCRPLIQTMRNAKPHRICYFMPAWMRDGYRSAAHHFRAHREKWMLEYYAADPTHPQHALAKQALALQT